jgi:catechol 2,3-dioxygenase-like lactoylglutathione lyase family enzyme
MARGPVPPPIQGAVLDHVAHAVPRWQDVWNRYAEELGAEWSSGGPGLGFAPAQLRFGNGARVEVLMPNAVETNDFLARFLERSGPGPHHVTFKVPDLGVAVEAVREHGFEPIGIDVSDPEWMEAFIHPKQASGVVVQLAQQSVAWLNPAPEDYPTARRQRRDGGSAVPAATLRRVTHAVADLDGAAALFVGLLGADVAQTGSADGMRWMDLVWPGPLGIRLVGHETAGSQTGPLSEWLGGRIGRIHHLELSAEEPDAIPLAHRPEPAEVGIRPWTDGSGDVGWEIDPSDNAGLRLVIYPPG